MFHPCLTDFSFRPKNPLLEDATMELICGALADAVSRRLDSAAAVIMNFVAVISIVDMV